MAGNSAFLGERMARVKEQLLGPRPGWFSPSPLGPPGGTAFDYLSPLRSPGLDSQLPIGRSAPTPRSRATASTAAAT